MSYRLDEGRGRCTYHIGVEDDGCHSLLDYPSISESAWILESIARSLNSIVLERKIIQNEIVEEEEEEEETMISSSSHSGGKGEEDENNNDTTEVVNGDADVTPKLKLTTDRSSIIVVDEPPVLGRGTSIPSYGEHLNEDEKEEKGDEDEGGLGETSENGSNNNNGKKKHKLCTEEGSYTRCELTIQRIETHLLDPSPLSLSSLSRASSFDARAASFDARSSSFGDGVDITATELARANLDWSAEALSLSTSTHSNGNSNKEEKGDAGETKSLSDSPQSKGDNKSVSPSKNKNATSEEEKPISVEETLSTRNIRVAVVGNVDAGKSTLIGTLTTSFLDDGRGSSRTAIMKHRHEIESGRTSTSSSHLLGFRQSGESIAGRDKIRSNKMKSEDEIARSSYRIITLMDLAGHEKYLKTTIHGVSSGMADYGLILVNSRHPPTHMTQHHLNLCCSYGIPVIVVFTKIDNCPEHALATSKKELSKLLKSPDIGKRPFAIKTEQDVATCMGKLHTLAPLIDISCVTGEGLDLLRQLLFALPKRRKHEKKVNRPFEFLVEDVFNNVPGVGSVVSGFVNAGELSVGTTQVYIGPTDDGSFLRTVAKSAHIARINTTHVTAGQSATLAFSLNKEMRKKLRRGMVVMTENPTSTREFDAEICVLKGEGTTIRESYQAYVHILNVRQTAFARNIEIVNNNALGLPPSHNAKHDSEGIVLRPGSRAKVRFEFAKRPVSYCVWRFLIRRASVCRVCCC